MNLKSVIYQQNSDHKPVKPVPPPREVIKEVIKEIPQESTDDHVEQYIRKKTRSMCYQSKARQS